jgi:hypothetical protein
MVMDTERIYEHCANAQAHGEEISDACARMIAAGYAEGMPSASFATTGAISGPSEVWRDCFYLRNGTSLYETMCPEDKLAADMLGTYLTSATRETEGRRGPVEGWSGLWIDEPENFTEAEAEL